MNILTKGIKAQPILCMNTGAPVNIMIPQQPQPVGLAAQPVGLQRKRQRRRERQQIDSEDDNNDNIDEMVEQLAEILPIRRINPMPIAIVEPELDLTGDNEEVFWKMIDKFNWHNISDGLVNNANVQHTISKYTLNQRNLFKEYYNNLFGILKEKLELDAMFARNNIVDDTEKAKIISHIIGLGHDQFNTLSDDMEILQFLISMNECQSLHDLLPNFMK